MEERKNSSPCSFFSSAPPPPPPPSPCLLFATWAFQRFKQAWQSASKLIGFTSAMEQTSANKILEFVSLVISLISVSVTERGTDKFEFEKRTNTKRPSPWSITIFVHGNYKPAYIFGTVARAPAIRTSVWVLKWFLCAYGRRGIVIWSDGDSTQRVFRFTFICLCCVTALSPLHKKLYKISLITPRQRQPVFRKFLGAMPVNQASRLSH